VWVAERLIKNGGSLNWLKRCVMLWHRRICLKQMNCREFFLCSCVRHVGVPVATLHKTTKFNQLSSISTRKSANFCFGVAFKIASKLLFSFQMILHSRHKCLNWMLAKSIFSSKKCTNLPVTLIGIQDSYKWNLEPASASQIQTFCKMQT